MTQSKLTALAVCALVQLHVSLECHAFTARLTRPWRFKRGHLRIRTRQQPKSVSAIPAATLEQHTSPVRNSQVSDSSLHLSSTDDIGQAERAEEEKRAEIEVFPAVVLGANSTMMEATSSERLSATLLTETEPSTGTIRSQLGLLTGLTRPSNFPGIVVFHVLGIYLALSSVGRMDAFVHVLLGNPSMWLVFSSIVLVSSTSMVVNDYYDAKLGRDKNTDRPLAKGTLSFPLVRRYLSYLYAASLLCSALLPGAPARLSVLFALMLTYKYTNSLKPITWVKNAVCAFLIAFAPLTSGSAALFLVSEKAGMMSGLSILGVGSIWRVAAMLFFGILGREITMDCNDVENDRAVGVRTIPVVHGPVYASRIAFASAAMSAMLALMGPLGQITKLPTSVWTRRLGFAATASIIQMYGAWRVMRTEGRNREVVTTSVDAGVKTILLFVASYF